MTITKTENMIEVTGVVKTISDSQTLIDAIESVKESGSVTLKIYDSFTLPSSVIGHLLKTKDSGVEIHTLVQDEILYELLDDLSLIAIFNVKKI